MHIPIQTSKTKIFTLIFVLSLIYLSILFSSDTQANSATTNSENSSPEITSLSKDSSILDGGEEVTILGKNFSSDIKVFLGDSQAQQIQFINEGKITFRIPKQQFPGARTLTLQTNNGVAQRKFNIFSKPLSSLNNGEITTIVGGVGFLGDGAVATKAAMFPNSIAIDKEGNLLIADLSNKRLRKVNAITNIITTLAGTGAENPNSENIPSIIASIRPDNVVVEASGNILISDPISSRIRRINTITGLITTVAGNGEIGSKGDGGLAINAQLFLVSSIAVDNEGNIFALEFISNIIRRIDAKSGIINTFAGNGKRSFSGDGGPAIKASFGGPSKIAVDQQGNLYVVDSVVNRIRKIDKTTGIITTVAGNGLRGFTGDDVLATETSLNNPSAIAIDRFGNIFISDTQNQLIRVVDARTGFISTIIGMGTKEGEDLPLEQAKLFSPTDIVLDKTGNIFFIDGLQFRIRKIDLNTNRINTVAGTGEIQPIGDKDLAIGASLLIPEAIAVDKSDNLLISDFANNRIRKVTMKTGIIDTIAGTGERGFDGDNGFAITALLNQPGGIVVNKKDIFFTDGPDLHIRQINKKGFISTVAGKGTNTDDNIPAEQAKLLLPIHSNSIATDKMGNIFLADLAKTKVRKIDAKTKIITSVAGSGKIGFSGDGADATKADLGNIFGVGADEKGNLFIVDTINNRIRRVDMKTGIIVTVAGNGRQGNSGDGDLAIKANLTLPSNIVIDKAGNIFIAESASQRIRRVDGKTAIITTIAGTANMSGFSGDGADATKAKLNFPDGLAVDKEGNLFIADSSNNAIRVVKGVAQK